MQTGRTEKIGNVVLDYSHYPEQDFYCDGASEDALLELVKTIPPGELGGALPPFRPAGKYRRMAAC